MRKESILDLRNCEGETLLFEGDNETLTYIIIYWILRDILGLDGVDFFDE